jgi:hypothetical protein
VRNHLSIKLYLIFTFFYSLVKTNTRVHGLPEDVFDTNNKGLSLSASVKFLTLSCSNSGMFEDLKVKKKSKKGK